jgi:amidase
MNQSEIVRLSATKLQRMIQRKELSPADVVEACLEQVQACNHKINAICTLNEKALDEAHLLEQKSAKDKEMGLLHGLPVGIKDVTPVAGIRTTFGSLLYRDYVPKEDALVVRRLKQAGAIILGKTNTPEFATGGNTYNEIFGRTRNPWNPELSSGGSTGGGAAALASGMIALADGTDLGGSLRIPASFCGIVGLRPSPGLVPVYPSEFAWDNLNVCGPVARTVEDAALMLKVMSGASPLSPVSQLTDSRNFIEAVGSGIPKGVRIAYCPDIAGIGIDPEIEKVCRKAAFDMTQVGAKIHEIDFDLSFAWEAYVTIRGFWMVTQHYKHLDKLDQLSDNLRGNIQLGLKVTMEELAAAEQTRGKLWLKGNDFFQKYDYLVTPTMAVPPFSVEKNYPEEIVGKKMKTYIDWFAPTFLLSLTGLPVASVPCGLDNNSLPVGIQIVGPQMGEERVLALAKQIQDAHPIGFPALDKMT